jgi:hypothetical protein
MDRGEFELEILGAGKAEVYLSAPEDAVPWGVVELLDRAKLRVVGPLPGTPPASKDARVILAGCSGIVSVAPPSPGFEDGRPAVPCLEVCGGTPEGLEPFVAAVLERSQSPSYAFMIGRLERDFRHAREAIRAAVEGVVGVPCLWVDDGRHRTNVDSVRDRTRLLIQHATFIIADLTLGVESPNRENPSRAHEIGMAIAYQRPLLLSSQEPRRYPYFSIGDMQMSFWETEDELERVVRDWFHSNQRVGARRVFNHELEAPVVRIPTFAYDPALRYVGPKTRSSWNLRRILRLVGLV